ncbi:glycosyltransferase family 4 protein [Oxalobacteraceae bacterium R-40]|uniref:Glycosyltransferase family 4 protein n=1 Tax=Keguizhuia sedimenti TaxID=3064264 RepID=A0ABU1BNK1_9BURK|nr:glycosyltransferase family 4 protein [Oxalobacteraceae bacterium R-40]
MKIAQVAPVHERVPPRKYGGTERVISYLTEELINQGHEVTLFATGDSITKGKLVSAVGRSQRFDMSKQEWLMYQCMMLDQIAELAGNFDVIHFHTDYLHFPLLRNLPVPHVTTLHGRLDLPELAALYRHFDQVPLVSISNTQRIPLPWVNWLETIHHGLPADLYRFNSSPEDYFMFIGRISPEKRLDRAIEIALRCNTPLRIAAKVDKVDEGYFNETIKPLLGHPLIDFIGEIDEQEKNRLLGNARALLFPIDWPEPFGMVMIESFACGTPVIAYRHGSVPEIMEQGVTGFIVENQDEAIQAAQRIHEVDRAQCRKVFEERFTVKRMAQKYLSVYQRVQLGNELNSGAVYGQQNPAWRTVVHTRDFLPRGRTPARS